MAVLNDLDTIRIKIRRLTRSPSEAQITDDQIDDYINTFILYDFPEHVRLFTTRTKFSFYTQPYVDIYDTNTDLATSPLYNFRNVYTTVHTPAYIDGYDAKLSQSEAEFYGIYPKTSSVKALVATGDGATVDFDGTLSAHPVTQENVMFTSVDANGNGIILVDEPEIDPVTGQRGVNGDLIVPNAVAAVGTINYYTGVYDLTFPVAPDDGATIYSHTLPYSAARPNTILYYNNIFTVRPIPDKVYKITMEAYKRPTELLFDDQVPGLEQWASYIAYGAAKKVFEDRMDTESIEKIMPEFKQQEILCLRRTIVQQSDERTDTIYTGQTGSNYSNNGRGGQHL